MIHGVSVPPGNAQIWNAAATAHYGCAAMAQLIMPESTAVSPPVVACVSKTTNPASTHMLPLGGPASHRGTVAFHACGRCECSLRFDALTAPSTDASRVLGLPCDR
jgi:hypothetical protein